MKLQSVFGCAATVALAAGSGIHQRHAHQNHGGNDVWYTEVKVETVVVWETIWASNSLNTISATASASQAEQTSFPSLFVPVETSAAHEATIDPATTSTDLGKTIESATGQASTEASATAPEPSATLASSDGASVTAAPNSGTSGSSGDATSTASNLSPQGRKAGLSGYVGIQKVQAFTDLAPYISWYSDYMPNTPTTDNVTGVGMLWGANGSPCGSEVTNRLAAFDNLVMNTNPAIMFGFYEPDCNCADSSEMSTSSGTEQWNALLAPLGKNGTILGSPSMCKQKDETWLQPFMQGGLDHDWDITSVHINKPDLEGIKEDIEYYASTYGKPIWVSEFACVHDQGGWNPCTDQGEIDQFINDAVKFFQGNDTVVAYGPSNGNGLGNTWPLTDVNGRLTASGQTYLNAIKDL